MSSPLPLVSAEKLASVALSHATREYPNKLDHVIAGPDDVRAPRELHPIFYGSFDWHSNVHAYWLLATLYRVEPKLPQRGDIQRLFDEQITQTKVAAELEYLMQPIHATFERPYGWAWLLMLAAELSRHTASWSRTLQPLTDAFVERFHGWLARATYPGRAGTHGNTAFAIALALEYEDDALKAALGKKARAWYGRDLDCQAWEPGGEDFLSPALVEAECMRRVLPRHDWHEWLGAFLPRLSQREPAALFEPAVVSDRADGKIVHLDGLNLSRAWCWRAMAASLDNHDPRRAMALETAAAHLECSLPQVAGDYMGEHWLATFALLACL